MTEIYSLFNTKDFFEKRHLIQINYSLLILCLTLVSIGLITVAAASMDFAANRYQDPWYLVRRQLIYIAVSSISAIIMFAIPTTFWKKYGWLLFFVAIFTLIIVLIPGIGRRVNGAQRWLQFGPLSIQVSEIVKLCSILFFASYLTNSQYFLQTQWRELLKPILMLVVLMWLLLLEPDFGGAVVLAVTVGAMLFLAGAKLWQCFLLLVIGTVFLAILILSENYRLDRLMVFKDPWMFQYSGGYQLTQSLIAFGRGEWFGLGLGNSIQKMLYLPEAHTDFIFAIFAEEHGFIGVVFLFGLFALLIYQIIRIALKAMRRKDTFITLAAFGVAVLFSCQILINTSVASGFLPTKGLTLPFISYGGSSLIVNFLFIALLLRFDYDLDADVIGDSNLTSYGTHNE
ncbi:MAG: cell division protein FtsW [Cellvibrionaceae bacterium]|jgi:cell division protein FtsW